MIRERQFEILKSSQTNPHLLCSICRDVFYNPIRATCGHTFCGSCLVRWIQMKKSCPLCRHKLERNYKFDKDILATKIVGDLEVKCLRCQQWEGTLAQFKQHKKSECTFVQTNSTIPPHAIQIGDDDDEFTFAGTIEEDDHQNQQILENFGRPIIQQEDQQIGEVQQSMEQMNDQQELQNISIVPMQEQASSDMIPQQQEESPQIEPQQQKDVTLLNQEVSLINAQTQQPSSSEKEQLQVGQQFQEILQSAQQSMVIEEQQIEPQIPIKSDEKNLQERVEEQHLIQEETIMNKKNENLPITILQEDQDVEIIEPPIRILNTKEVKQFKSAVKFKINILRNTIKIAEPIEQISDKYFLEFVAHMKNEMIKKLSDIEYYNTLFG